MGNLGAYQLMTTAAKKVGGPIVLAVGTAISGWVVLRTAEAGGKKAVRAIKAKLDGKKQSSTDANRVFEVVADGDAGAGLKLQTGDIFRVLQRDGDSVLIEVVDDQDNPYFVSGKLLSEVSDFPGPDTANGAKSALPPDPLEGGEA